VVLLSINFVAFGSDHRVGGIRVVGRVHTIVCCSLVILFRVNSISFGSYHCATPAVIGRVYTVACCPLVILLSISFGEFDSDHNTGGVYTLALGK
jgi:hypothetical protein